MQGSHANASKHCSQALLNLKVMSLPFFPNYHILLVQNCQGLMILYDLYVEIHPEGSDALPTLLCKHIAQFKRVNKV